MADTDAGSGGVASVTTSPKKALATLEPVPPVDTFDALQSIATDSLWSG